MFSYLFRRLFLVKGYIANYGYTDATGDYYIIIDSEKCDSCGRCVDACPEHIFEVAPDDYDDLVARVRDDMVQRISYLCAACKPISQRPPLKCQLACSPGAIIHSW